MSTLTIRFIDEERVLNPGDELSFGRAADLDIDDNQFLHRQLGRFVHHGDSWWVANLGSSIVLNVVDHASPSVLKVAPGTSVPLAFNAAFITFEAGGAAYELEIKVAGQPVPVTRRRPTNDAADRTTDVADIPLTPEQKLLLLGLAEPQLRSGGTDDTIPTNRQVMSKFGWSDSTFNRKLDKLCAKFDRAGVRGLVGSTDSLARDRRSRLVEHSISTGIITADDLDILDEFPRPNRHQ